MKLNGTTSFFSTTGNNSINMIKELKRDEEKSDFKNLFMKVYQDKAFRSQIGFSWEGNNTNKN